MRSTLTITRRELLAFFCSPIAYVVLVVFLSINGFIFAKFNLVPGEEASLRMLYGQFLPLVLLLIIPMLTMRLMSEEYRSGTIESLMTAPVSDAAVVCGKFLGTLAFYLCMLAATLIYVLAIAVHASPQSPDFGALLALYVGLVLVGGLYISVGLFFSACTSNQIIAVISSFAVLSVPALFAGLLAASVEGTPRVLLQHIYIRQQFLEFVQGALNLSSITFFVSSTMLMLFLSVKTVESRRWR